MTHTQSEDNMTGGWKTVKLGEICDLIAGYAFKSKDFGRFDDKVIKIANITPHRVDMDSLVGINLSKYNRSTLAKFIAHEGDYVLAMTGATIGKLGRVRSGCAYINQRVLMFKNKESADKDFLYYALQQYDFKQYVFNHIDSETAQPNISAGTIGKYQLSLPPLDVQRRIAAVLRPLDDKIELNAHINARLERAAQALFKRQFVRFEPYGGTMPPSWRAGTIGEIITPKRGKNLLSKDAVAGDVPVVAGGLEPSVYHNTANTKAPVLTISGSGANAGFVRLWMRDVWSSDSSFIDSAMSEDVFFWYVLLKSRQEEIYGAQTGSAQPHIYPKNIAEMKCIIPAAEAIKEYCDLVSPMFEKIGFNTDESRTLARLRDVLLPRLMSGEVDVRRVRLA